MSIYISIDPGVATGVCVWRNGIPDKPLTFYTKAESFPEKISDIVLKVDTYLYGPSGPLWTGNSFALIEEVCIEQAHIHTPKNKLENVFKMMKVVGALTYYFASKNVPVRELIKHGSQTKNLAAVLCKWYGFDKVSEHAKDSLHIGLCAGYNREAAIG